MNKNLHFAKQAKNDEFYTRLEDIEKELKHYKKHFKNRTVYCNCDDPTWSAFWEYFHLNFENLGLKKLISTHYDKEEPTYKMEYFGGNDTDIEAGIKTPLESNGDFRNAECIELLKESDIVCTNPPFSLFREYVAQLMEYEKEFLIIGNMNAITYKEIFPLIKENKIWAGYGFNMSLVFKTPYPNLLEANRKFVISKGYDPDEGYVKTPAICWYTNLDISKRHEPLILKQRYYDDDGNPLPDVEDRYPHYDNYDAINVDRVADIPIDYVPCWFKCPNADKCDWAKAEGLDNEKIALCETPVNGHIGVPISYLDKHTDKYEIVGADIDLATPMKEIAPDGTYEKGGPAFYVKKKLNIADSTRELLFERKCNGLIGIPITFLNKYKPEQFELIGVFNHGSDGPWDFAPARINNKEKYKRLAIRTKMQRYSWGSY